MLEIWPPDLTRVLVFMVLFLSVKVIVARCMQQLDVGNLATGLNASFGFHGFSPGMLVRGLLQTND